MLDLKALAQAKGRLAPAVGPLQRRLLAIAMFEDVVAALEAVPALAAPPTGAPAEDLFDRALRKMINAFEERAARLYGDSDVASPAEGSPGISSSSAQSAA